jgi:hypothetical protein
VEIIKKQILAACLGVQDAVEKLQTVIGIKNKIAQHWIDILVVKAREKQAAKLSKNSPTRDPRLNSSTLKGEQREAVKNEIREQIQQELFA